jgi:hypothetical protein
LLFTNHLHLHLLLLTNRNLKPTTLHLHPLSHYLLNLLDNQSQPLDLDE